jgi:hypothetical protein
MFNSSRWEDRFGAITSSCLLIKFFYPIKENDEQPFIDSELRDFVWNWIRIEQIPRLLKDSEFKVRSHLGRLLKDII